MRALSSSPVALLRLAALGALLGALGLTPPTAAAAGATRTIVYRGARLRIPASWPVFDLARQPRTCVRFNRHALYLGQPSADQLCPTAAVGRTEAILLQPLERGAERPALGPRTLQAAAQPRSGSVAVLVRRDSGVLITATWGQDPGLLRAILADPAIGRARASGAAARSESTGAQASASTSGAAAHRTSAGVHAAAASIYTGLGFDACSAPSASQLAAWQSSPFRAYGIYIGGANMACAQGNLTAAYVAQEVAAGWHLIPTYVGLQAPGNSCGCAAINPSQASAEGTAAAQDAAADAQALGIETGNPIYFDMEAYGRTSKATQAVLQFLAAWTAELHAQGYLSGVYVADDSGVPDLVSQWGTGYLEPDELWIANWNGQQSTSDPAVPSSEWASHQRIHQYRGGHNDDYGGVRMNIDSDYLDGATVGSGGVVGTPGSAPSLSISPQAAGIIKLRASWTGESGIVGWRLLGGDSAQALVPLSGEMPSGQIVSHNAFAYFAAQALSDTGQVLGTTAATPTPAHLALYGGSIFVAARAGLAGVPVGCFTGAGCRVHVTVSAGRTLIASAGPEDVRPDTGGIVSFRLTATGRRLLSSSRSRRLPVTVALADLSGVKASKQMTLVPFTASGRAPYRSATPAPTLRTVGGTDFVSSHGTGGILAACDQPAPCAVSAQLTASGARIASTGREYIGAHQLGYLMFRLSGRGRALLAGAAGHQLPAQVTLSDANATAYARIALVAFS